MDNQNNLSNAAATEEKVIQNNATFNYLIVCK